ncbi:MAG: hypothetical protein K9L98_02735 [Candidatus Pacebacteria bacterium]|nr:hypothetical protein [Candidatus Paceibacterota bacterium]MCF7862901.1 hypothetical protein [Candidatus Paceibacterota bacterium]
MSSKSDYSKKILGILGQKTAISLENIKKGEDSKAKYALTRSVKNMIEGGLAEIHKSTNQTFLKITPKGKAKLNCLKLEGKDALVSNSWDGMWRIIILDMPETRKNERDSLRYILKKANFVCIKNTVWVSPFPYEHLFYNLKKDLGLSTELIIIVTNKVDDDTAKNFLESIKS